MLLRNGCNVLQIKVELDLTFSQFSNDTLKHQPNYMFMFLAVVKHVS